MRSKLYFEVLVATVVHGGYIYLTNTNHDKVFVNVQEYRTHRKTHRKTPVSYLDWLDVAANVLTIDIRLQGGHTGSNRPVDAPFLVKLCQLVFLKLRNQICL